MLAVTANDPDALALRAVWADQETGYRDPRRGIDQAHLGAGECCHPDPRADRRVTAAAAIVPSTSPVVTPTNAAIVILGYGLRPNGTMAPELVKRLEAGLAQAQASPTAPVFVTGGVLKKGITEAAAMKKWLVGRARGLAHHHRGQVGFHRLQRAEHHGVAEGSWHLEAVLVTSPGPHPTRERRTSAGGDKGRRGRDHVDEPEPLPRR